VNWNTNYDKVLTYILQIMNNYNNGYLEFKDFKIFFETIGRGPVILFVHGGMGYSHDYFRSKGVELLAALGYKCVMYDQRGHGKSSKSEIQNYTNRTWANDLIKLVDHINPQAILGHSYGGYITLEALLNASMDYQGKVILLNTSCGPIPKKNVPKYDNPADFKNRKEKQWNTYFHDFKEEYWEQFKQIKFNHEPHNAAFIREIIKYDVSKQLKNLRNQTLVLAGCDDHYFSEVSVVMHALLPNSQIKLLGECGHFPFIEKPKSFADAIHNFMSDMPG